MNQRIENFDIHEFFLLIKKHMVFILVVCVICALAGFGISQWVLKPQYESDAIVIVNAAQPSAASDLTKDQITVAQQLVNTYSIILKSDPVLDQVIQNLGLDTTAKKLAKSITIVGVNDTEVIDITVRGSDPQVTADIANAIIQVAPTAIINTVNAGSVGIISPAKKADEPVSPNKPLNTGIFFLSGLLASVVLSIVKEMLNNTFSSGKDVQKYLDYPVLGIIPNLNKHQYQLR